MKKTLLIISALFISIGHVNALTINVTDPSGANYAPLVTNSLPWAINQINSAGAGPHVINIMVATTVVEGQPAPYSLTNSNVTIDGTKAPGFSCVSGAPKFILQGPAFNSFNVSGNNVTFLSIGITQFSLNVTGSGFKMFGC